MKFRKLGSEGFAHHLLLALVVVGVVAGGVYYMVQSKADTYTYKDGVIWQDGLLTDANGVGTSEVPTLNKSIKGVAANQVAVSPTGNLVAYIGQNSDGKARLMTAQLDFKNFVAPNGIEVGKLDESVAGSASTTWAPIWSADNAKIIVRYSNGGNNNRLWMVKSDGSKGFEVNTSATKITDDTSIAWTADSGHIAYVENGNICILTVSSKVTNKPSCKKILGEPGYSYQLQDVTLDNRKFMLFGKPTSGDLSRPTALYSVGSSGKNFKELVRSYTDKNTGKKLVIGAEGSARQTAVFSPDGKSLLVQGSAIDKDNTVERGLFMSRYSLVASLRRVSDDTTSQPVWTWNRYYISSSFAATCKISAPSRATYGSTINAVVTFKNKGASTISIKGDAIGTIVDSTELATGVLKPSEKATQSYNILIPTTYKERSTTVNFSGRMISSRGYPRGAEVTCKSPVIYLFKPALKNQ